MNLLQNNPPILPARPEADPSLATSPHRRYWQGREHSCSCSRNRVVPVPGSNLTFKLLHCQSSRSQACQCKVEAFPGNGVPKISVKHVATSGSLGMIWFHKDKDSMSVHEVLELKLPVKPPKQEAELKKKNGGKVL